MKKILSICLIATMMFAFGSCTKEAPKQGGQNPFYVPGGGGNVDPGNDGTDPNVDPDPQPTDIGPVPADFTPKVLIEKLTGEWCPACPSGAVAIEGIVNANAGKVFSASWQMSNGDPFEIPEASDWRMHISAGAGLGGFSFPSASINRQVSITSGTYDNAAIDLISNANSQVSTALAKNPECGLALVTSEADDKIDVDVYVGFNNAITTANTMVTVYLIENEVAESSPGAQAGGGGSYVHKHMIRDVMTSSLGDAIDLSTVTADKYVKHEIKGFDIAGKPYDKSKLSVLAFVNVKAAAGKDLAVLNVQEVHLGDTKKFD